MVNEASTSKNFDSKMEVDEELDSNEPDLHRLWIQLFRVMDDVHDGTRKAAEGTAKLVSKVSSFLFYFALFGFFLLLELIISIR